MLNTSYSSVFFLMLLAFSSCNAQSKPTYTKTKTEPLVGQPNQSPQTAVEPSATDTKQQPASAAGTSAVSNTSVFGYDSGYESDGGTSRSSSSSMSPPVSNRDSYNTFVCKYKSDPNQPAGLKNLGNTCFMNASLQIIAALYADKLDKAPIELQNVIQAINGNYQAVAEELLGNLRTFLGSLKNDKGTKILAIATSGNQECACEFLTLLNQTYPFMAKWLEQTDSGSSSTSSILLLPPIQADIIKKLSETGTYDKYNARYTVTAKQDAEILAIHLDRNANFIKLDTQVTNTETIQVRNEGGTGINNFELSGFIVHDGKGRGGHYYAYVKKGNTWYCATDATVTRVTEHEAIGKSAGASLLFYKN